jgi:hypothetical protein
MNSVLRTREPTMAAPLAPAPGSVSRRAGNGGAGDRASLSGLLNILGPAQTASARAWPVIASGSAAACFRCHAWRPPSQTSRCGSHARWRLSVPRAVISPVPAGCNAVAAALIMASEAPGKSFMGGHATRPRRTGAPSLRQITSGWPRQRACADGAVLTSSSMVHSRNPACTGTAGRAHLPGVRLARRGRDAGPGRVAGCRGYAAVPRRGRSPGSGRGRWQIS